MHILLSINKMNWIMLLDFGAVRRWRRTVYPAIVFLEISISCVMHLSLMSHFLYLIQTGKELRFLRNCFRCSLQILFPYFNNTIFLNDEAAELSAAIKNIPEATGTPL